MLNYYLAEETLGYQTSTDPSSTDKRLLIGGSKNVLIDAQNKVKTRSGYTRLGAANTSVTPNRNGWTWNTSTGFKAPLKFYDDELEIYLGTVDGYAINAWTRVLAGWSTTEKMRAVKWYDNTEKIDLFLMVIGDDNIYEWSGGVAVVSSITGVTITKKGTSTFAQNRFYTSRDKTLICVRTGTEYVYTGGESTTTLTGIADTTGLAANDILIQKIVTQSNKPAADRNNDIIYNFQNQICIGSYDDALIYISKNSDYDDFSHSSPRVPGEGEILTLSDPTKAIGTIGSTLVIFSGNSTAFKVKFEQVTVGSTLTEAVIPEIINLGENQGALCQEGMLEVGNSLIYLSNEVALRIISDPLELGGLDPKTLSNPIKPDFDAEDWYNGAIPDAFLSWYKNIVLVSAPQGSHLYMLNYIEDADGKLKRYWNPPQVLPVGPMVTIDLSDGKGELLYGHSNATPETYLLFDGASDGQYSGMAVEDKLPIDAKAVFAYDNFQKPANLKTFDEYYIKGEITPNTKDLICTLNYDVDGYIQKIDKTIDGSDDDILEGSVQFNSLAQQSLAVNPLGGFLNPPSDARRFSVIFEIAKEDFFEISASFSTNEVDRYWAILMHGPNVELSKRKPTNKKL